MAQRLVRDREEAARELAEQVAEQERGRGLYHGPGVIGVEAPGEVPWRAPWAAEDKIDHGQVEVPG